MIICAVLTGARHGVWVIINNLYNSGGAMACLYLDKDFNVRISLWADEPKIPRKNRGTCGAKTRQGTPCKAPPVWNITIDKAINGRCKLHGGMSTGAKTEAGREAIRESNRRRRLMPGEQDVQS